MIASPLSSPLFAGGLTDTRVSKLFSESTFIRAMLRVEGALARAQGALGVVPADAAEAIETVCSAFEPSPDALAGATARDGVTVPGLVAALREAVGEEHAAHVHFGATSQDIMDTAFVLCAKSALDVVAPKLDDLCMRLARLADAHRPTLCVARTRGMQAVPTVFGLRVVNWLGPIARYRNALPCMREDALRVSLGGAAGTMSALGPKAMETADALARVLDLHPQTVVWHTQRGGMKALSDWCSGLCGTLGNMGADMLVMAQSEVGEISFAGAGGSSTMPNKSNPVLAEILVALAGHTALLSGAGAQTQVTANERDGVSWMREWCVLPQIICAMGAAMARADEAVDRLRIDTDRMRSNLDASNGLVLAEAATFTLATYVPRPAATMLVKQACERTLDDCTHLIDALSDMTPKAIADKINWPALRDPANAIGHADALIDRALDEAVA